MGAETATNRKYAWGLQADYQTAKTLSAGALKQMIVTDQNALQYGPVLGSNADWSHGYNTETEEWLEAHGCSVQHEFPGFSQELGKIFFLSMADTVTTPGGGTNSRKHTFVPTDPATTRQDRAVTYVEKLGTGWFKKADSMVSDGFGLSGNNTGMLMASLNLMGSGAIESDPSVTFPPTSTPTVTNLSGLAKLFNTQVALTPDDGDSYTDAYACRYRSFNLTFRKTMLDAAGYQPGCQRFFVDGDQTSGIIRSAHEFDKQMLDFSFEVDMASGPELDCVMDQRPITLVLDVTGGIIESTIHHQLTVTIHIAKYQTTTPVLVDGQWRLTISGKALYSTADSELFKIELVNDVTTYSSGW